MSRNKILEDRRPVSSDLDDPLAKTSFYHATLLIPLPREYALHRYTDDSYIVDDLVEDFWSCIKITKEWTCVMIRSRAKNAKFEGA